jgi:hypothetical protein
MKRLLALVSAAALASCAAGTTTGSSDGTVNGSLVGPNNSTVTINVVEGNSITYSGTQCGGGDAESAVVVTLSDRGGTCSGLENNGNVSSSTVLVLSIAGSPASSGGSAPSIGANNYPVGNALTDSNGNIFAAVGTVFLFDATCGMKSQTATSGSITVSSVSGGVASGSFSLTFATGTLTGTFDAPACQLTANEFCAIGSATGCSG